MPISTFLYVLQEITLSGSVNFVKTFHKWTVFQFGIPPPHMHILKPTSKNSQQK